MTVIDAKIKELDDEEARLREAIRKQSEEDEYDDDFDIDLPENSEEAESVTTKFLTPREQTFLYWKRVGGNIPFSP